MNNDVLALGSMILILMSQFLKNKFQNGSTCSDVTVLELKNKVTIGEVAFFLNKSLGGWLFEMN